MIQQLTDADIVNSHRLLDVLTALNEGDFSRRLPADQEGIAGAIAGTLNTLLDRLQEIRSEMNRITWEVGTAGLFGGQAEVGGLSGAWKELTDNLNVMGSNLTEQVRDITSVTSEVARSNSSRRVTVNAQGEMLLLKDLVNTLVDQCNGRQSQHSAG